MASWSHLASFAVALALVQAAASEHWLNDYFTTDGNVRAGYDASGQEVATVNLNQQTGGGGFNSKKKFLFGEFSIRIKLIPGNSAGTVSCFYLSSGDDQYRDEIDMEFMGNSSGQPVVLNTNVWANGDGKKEHQFDLWFDPSADYHTYTIIWNPQNIIFKVDNNVIRSFKRYADLPYPNSKPMNGPFTVSYRDYFANACVGGRKCPAHSGKWINKQPSKAEWDTIAWAEKNYMRYDYCQDGYRFPQGFLGECSRN
ncbi:hypothetical protein PR202_gb25496 [Eleusine coracana subsp. coracana]|uniref:Xyloglucan endotransglucosylase/hydrolase n=1 Tax=Eleusine coracana subsp. coracana TaxID=191504 RepID=A0AAV5FP50_ELECO|nr:hypothetical protein PR202_gb25496 [Eleusine coracana subsp. coracana]